MSLKKKPVTGMKDILPQEMEIRNYVMDLIKKTYASYGFVSMETPCIEHIENLSSKQGGENEKLIFKILKRGEKLKLKEAQSEADLVDGGLRYDLTVPLARYYANHVSELPSPFKALQMGNVWRADRPQRGRFRQFMQCDIDILGEPSALAEIELIQATSSLVGQLGFETFTVRINDRRILKAMAAFSGFPEESYDTVFIILDKMDKIGVDGVRNELTKEGFTASAIDQYLGLFEKVTPDLSGIRYLQTSLAGYLDESVAQNLMTIVESVETVKTAECQIVFDPTLVRGMSYYTGTIFEISIDGFGGSVAGGGRYDEMIGRFAGTQTCACGFSLGFERLVMLLMERNFQGFQKKEKVAYLLEKGISQDKLIAVFQEAQKEREAGHVVSINIMKKNKKFQKEQLTEQGYSEIKEFFCD